MNSTFAETEEQTINVYCGKAVHPGCYQGIASRCKFFFTNEKIPHNTLKRKGSEGFPIIWKFCGKLQAGDSLFYDIHEPYFWHCLCCSRGYFCYQDFKFLPNEEANALYDERCRLMRGRFVDGDERVIPCIITHEEASEKIVELEVLQDFDFSYDPDYWRE
jgi:hypothetical protein